MTIHENTVLKKDARCGNKFFCIQGKSTKKENVTTMENKNERFAKWKKTDLKKLKDSVVTKSIEQRIMTRDIARIEPILASLSPL